MFVTVLACLVAGIIVYPHLPAAFVSHWNIAGHPDGATSKFWGVYLLPLIMFLLLAIWAILPRVDPIDPVFKGFRYVYDFLIFLIIAFLAYVYALILGTNLGLPLSMTKMIMPAIAALIFILGALLPRIKRNWFVGIRTPWTISSDIVWDKTHKLGRPLLMIAALFILSGTFASPRLAVWLTILPLILAALICVVYSYFIFKSYEQ